MQVVVGVPQVLKVFSWGFIYTQEADRPNCSTPMPKFVVGVPQVLKVFPLVFIYIYFTKNWFGPKKIGGTRIEIF